MPCPVVVLTGGIASGKSAVSGGLKQLGACIIDTDVIARCLTEPGQPGFKAITAHWGDEVLVRDDNQALTLDRAKLREIIFSDPKQRQTLESILHPLIMAEVQAQLAALPDGECDYAVVVIPLYAEHPSLLKPDAVVVVDAPEAMQLARLIKRDGIDSSLARQMIEAQASRDQRRMLATDVVENDQDLATLDARIIALDQRLKARFKPNS